MQTKHRQPDIPATRSLPTVLVATSFDAASATALLRAHALAKILGARLVVLHVEPMRSRINMLFPHKHMVEQLAMQQHLFTSLDTGRTWCEGVLGLETSDLAMVVKTGRVAATILETAEEVDASIVVLGDSAESSAGPFGGGGVATTLIHRSPRPVLVARPERPTSEILAATNFADTEYPALCQAARLGVRLGSHVTFMHNVDTSEYVGTASLFGMPIHTSVLPTAPDRERRRHELADVALHMGHDIESLVVMKVHSADAILDVARSRDVDLVVVGARKRQGLTDRMLAGTAATVARKARRSVLTVPLHGREPAGWAA